MKAMTENMHLDLFIGGKSVPAVSGKIFEVEDPATGKRIATVAEGDAADIEKAVEAAEAAFPSWGGMEAEARARILNRAAEILTRRLPDFIDVEVSQTGRPVREMKAQLQRLPEWYSYFAAVARTHEGSVHPFGRNHLNYTVRKPLGVVGLVTPWNHPLLILTKKVAPALAAGNTLVVKPSELAPLTPIMLAEVLEEAGLPAGVYNVVPGFGATAGAALTSHPRIAKIDLTGGTETGRVVAAAAGKNLIPFAAELGGKASVVIFEDMADQAVPAALFASFIAAGQTCVQGARLLVERSIYDDVLKALVERANAIKIGTPSDPKTQMGPMISAKQRDLVEKYVEIGKAEGATLAAGGRRPEGEEYAGGYFYTPTIFCDVKDDMRVAQEEIFGPVVCVLPFETETEAITLANSTQFGLAASVWTRNGARGHRVAGKIEAGIVWINDHHRVDPASPWGGFKDSGLGKENGIVCYESYTKVQSVVANLSEDSFDWFDDDGREKRYS
ncbi:aldehyde dehydrogenase [Martelella limonii]|uniref:aldehyde dehydrogenase n=1 Tax=Martelella limonii TaxID=1647649 RepID=UPI0015805E3F|nr:aldehyde dehydrogenase [Martelella limonii]